MSKKNRSGLTAFMQTYGEEAACQAYLKEKRWPNGFICPKCGGRHGYDLANEHIRCADCRYEASVTAGTVMHRSHLPLTKWYLAMYLVCQDKRGISAVQLSNQLDVTYKTAWYVLARIRAAMRQRDSAYLLSGIVEFDDTYFGGPTVGKSVAEALKKRRFSSPFP